MRSTVWKYTLSSTINHFALPEGAELLTVASQRNDICMWVRVNPDAMVVPRTFFLVGTGCDAPDEAGNYIGSALVQDGKFVFHVFEMQVGGSDDR